MKYEDYTGNGHQRPSRAAQVQSDVETIRSEMSQTLMQLEERFSISDIIDEVISSARRAGSGSGDFFKNLATTVRDNPIPVLLIGVGVASLVTKDKTARTHERSSFDDMKQGSKQRAFEMKEKAGHVAERLKERAGGIKERAGEMKERAGHTLEQATGRASEKASELRDRVGDSMHRARSRSREVFNEQPLVVAGIGLAIGALLAAAPISQTERRLMSGKRKKLKQRLSEGVRETAERTAEGMDRGEGSSSEKSRGSILMPDSDNTEGSEGILIATETVGGQGMTGGPRATGNESADGSEESMRSGRGDGKKP